MERVILFRIRRLTRKWEYIGLIINDSKNRGCGGLRGHRWVYIFESYNLVVALVLGVAFGYDE